MSTFDESQHLRGTGGKFATKTNGDADDVALDDGRRLPETWSQADLDEGFKHYLQAAAWSSYDIGEDGEGHETLENFEFSDQTRQELREDFDDFVMANAALIDELREVNPSFAGPEQIGHDFWLTRCGHGAGFWDRGSGPVGQKLTDAAKVYGNVDLYLGDDEKIYC
jgi:hypothetical protein